MSRRRPAICVSSAHPSTAVHIGREGDIVVTISVAAARKRPLLLTADIATLLRLEFFDSLGPDGTFNAALSAQIDVR